MNALRKTWQTVVKRLKPFLRNAQRAAADALLYAQQLSVQVSQFKTQVWTAVWLGGLLLLWAWDFLFLNAPERRLLEIAFSHSMLIAGLVVVLTFVIGWLLAIALELLDARQKFTGKAILQFSLNLIRSIPQIVGVLLGYVWITHLMEIGSLSAPLATMTWMSVFLSLFIFPEVVDLLRERIVYFRQSDFYNAMRVSGISEWRIINYDILWKNSRIHILNKMIAVFSSAIFLQCSVDFIVSVGLSTRVNAVNLPVTLGSLLANIDSKQDILAIGFSLTHPSYLPNLLFLHLQGLSVAFVIVFTLLSLFKITNALAERFRL